MWFLTLVWLFLCLPEANAQSERRPLDLILTSSLMAQANGTTIRYILPTNSTGPLTILLVRNGTEAVILDTGLWNSKFGNLTEAKILELAKLTGNKEELLKQRLKQKLSEAERLEIALEELEDLLNEIEQNRRSENSVTSERFANGSTSFETSSERILNQTTGFSNISLIETSAGILIPISNETEDSVIESIKSALEAINATSRLLEPGENRTKNGSEMFEKSTGSSSEDIFSTIVRPDLNSTEIVSGRVRNETRNSSEILENFGGTNSREIFLGNSSEIRGNATDIRGILNEIRENLSEFLTNSSRIRGNSSEIQTRGNSSEIGGNSREIRENSTDIRGILNEIRENLSEMLANSSKIRGNSSEIQTRGNSSESLGQSDEFRANLTEIGERSRESTGNSSETQIRGNSSEIQTRGNSSETQIRGNSTEIFGQSSEFRGNSSEIERNSSEFRTSSTSENFGEVVSISSEISTNSTEIQLASGERSNSSNANETSDARRRESEIMKLLQHMNSEERMIERLLQFLEHGIFRNRSGGFSNEIQEDGREKFSNEEISIEKLGTENGTLFSREFANETLNGTRFSEEKSINLQNETLLRSSQELITETEIILNGSSAEIPRRANSSENFGRNFTEIQSNQADLGLNLTSSNESIAQNATRLEENRNLTESGEENIEILNTTLSAEISHRNLSEVLEQNATKSGEFFERLNATIPDGILEQNLTLERPNATIFTTSEERVNLTLNSAEQLMIRGKGKIGKTEKPKKPKTPDLKRKQDGLSKNQTSIEDEFSNGTLRTRFSNQTVFISNTTLEQGLNETEISDQSDPLFGFGELPNSEEMETLGDDELMELFREITRSMERRNITMMSPDDLEFLRNLLQIERRIAEESEKSIFDLESDRSLTNETLSINATLANITAVNETLIEERNETESGGEKIAKPRIRFSALNITVNATNSTEDLELPQAVDRMEMLLAQKENMTKLLVKLSQLSNMNKTRSNMRLFYPVKKEEFKKLKTNLQLTLNQLVKMVLANERLGVKTLVDEEAAFAEEALSNLNAMIISAKSLSELNGHVQDRFRTMPTLVGLMDRMDTRNMTDDPQRILRIIELLHESGQNPNLLAEIVERTLHSGVNFRRGIRRQQAKKPEPIPPIRGPILSNGTVMIMNPGSNTTTLPMQHYQNEYGMMPAPQYQRLRSHIRSQIPPTKHRTQYNSDFGYNPYPPPKPHAPPTLPTDSMGRSYHKIDRPVQYYHARGY